MVKLDVDGWKRVLLDSGEIVEVWAPQGECPERVQYPAWSGHYRMIVAVIDAPERAEEAHVN